MNYKAPFPWFGGKRRVAAEVWSRLGAEIPVYAEPFAGSLAVLLGRPGWTPTTGGVETVNDIDGFIANAWRAVLHDPEKTAHHADWPSNENDLHARHAWLVERREQMRPRLEGDPDWFDAKIAGWWLWGISQWIGSGFCSGDGAWRSVETAEGDRQLVHLGDAGRGVSRKLVQLGNAGPGVAGRGECGLLAWMLALSERLRRVRVCCGDWSRILTPAALTPAAPRGVFLDPPYSAEAGRDMGVYGENDDGDVAHAAREWAVEAGRDANNRIALCGYEGEGHDLLVAEHGWSAFSWSAKGGISKHQGPDSGGNNTRERIWFSPGCLNPAAKPKQASLF